MRVHVSTHSRLKAAGILKGQAARLNCCFNTQPPEGGWARCTEARDSRLVSTHSRLKAAGFNVDGFYTKIKVSTHSRLKAAGKLLFACGKK